MPRRSLFQNLGQTSTKVFDQQTREKSLFQCENRLTPDHIPDEPIGRDEEIDQIANAVRPLIRKKPAENLLVHGPAGTGKTTTVSHVLQQLEEETNVKTVSINCWQYNTRSSLLSHLLIELGYAAPRKGKPVDEIIIKLQEWLDKNRSIALVLDEFDQLQEQAEIVYDLIELSAETSNELGLVLVSNKPPSDLQLDPRSQSRLSYNTVHFQRYDVDDLRQIIKERAEHAFNSKTITDNVIHVIAEKVAQENGDCRKALSLLLSAGRKADQENAQQVALRHIPQKSEPVAA